MFAKLMWAASCALVASAALGAVDNNKPAPVAGFKPSFVTPPALRAPQAAQAAPAAAKPLPPPPVLSATQIVDRNVSARGGLKAWRGVTALTMEGQLDAGGKTNVELPYVMRVKRGLKSRLEIKFKDQTALQVYDGKQGWKVRPFLNRDEVEPFSAAEAKAASTSDELDGPLIDHAAKGIKVELAGTEVIDGRNTYKLRLSQAGAQQRLLWVDAITFLEARIEAAPRRMDGRMHKTWVSFKDFKTEAGLVTPRVLETSVEGVKVSRKLTVAKLKVNEAMPDALFTKPDLHLAMASVPAAPGK